MTACPPFDLHAAARHSATCGLTSDVQLRSHQVANLARSLRAIDAIAGVLAAETDDACSAHALVLGGYLRGGLIDAIAMLAGSAGEQLEQAHEQATSTARANAADAHLR